jgi:hypothetical protein
MLSVTTQGLKEIGTFRNRLAREYGRQRISWDDFSYLSEHLIAIEEKLVDIATNDPRRQEDDQQIGA